MIANCSRCGTPLSQSGPLCESCLTGYKEWVEVATNAHLEAIDFSQSAQNVAQAAWRMGYECAVRECFAMAKRRFSHTHLLAAMRERWPKLDL